MTDDPETENGEAGVTLRRGWTTGACATAAAKAALTALRGHDFPDPVTITLPGGQTPAFALALNERGDDFARVGVVKDAGDDPDVTHGALVVATVRRGPAGGGVGFKAGAGVGTVTRPGLPIGVGEPAINPVPRAMMRTAVAQVIAAHGGDEDVEIEIGIVDGEKLAAKTLNPRLGIVGGLSVLGTTGIVIPFSCSAWIHSIHRGIDVARAIELAHVAGATGSTSEAAIARMHGLPEEALIDMGDFVGGMLKYLKTHPVARVSVAVGFAKAVKLAQGLLDLHSKRGRVDHGFLARMAAEAGAGADLVGRIETANSGLEVLQICRAEGIDIGARVAAAAHATAAAVVAGSGIALELAVFDRDGGLVATTGFVPV